MNTNFYCNHVDYNVYPSAHLASFAADDGEPKSFASYPAAQKWLNSGHADKPDDTIDLYPIGTPTAAKYYLPDLPPPLSKSVPLPNGTLERNSLQAVILGLQAIAANKHAAPKKLIVVHVEELYIAGCMFAWAPTWKANNFRKATLPNADLIAQLWATMAANPFPIRVDYIHWKGSDRNVAVAAAL
jgi:hypothetical protein